LPHVLCVSRTGFRLGPRSIGGPASFGTGSPIRCSLGAQSRLDTMLADPVPASERLDRIPQMSKPRKPYMISHIPGFPLSWAIPRHKYEEYRNNGAITDHDHAVLFRPGADWSWWCVTTGPALVAAGHKALRQRPPPLLSGLSVIAGAGMLLFPAWISWRTYWLLDDQERVHNALREIRKESLKQRWRALKLLKEMWDGRGEHRSEKVREDDLLSQPRDETSRSGLAKDRPR